MKVFLSDRLHKRIGWCCSLIFSILIFQTTVAEGSNEAVFPGAELIRSPDNRYEITNHGDRVLVLGTVKKTTRRPVYQYSRLADILWAPDSKAFALNDNAGSNVSSALLFNVSNLHRSVNLGQRLYHSLSPSPNLRSLTGNDHIYFNVRRWISAKKLELVVAGYGNKSDPNGFTLVYQYDLTGGRFHLISRVEQFKNDVLFESTFFSKQSSYR